MALLRDDRFSGGQFATQVGNPSSKPAVWDGALANGATMIFRDGTSALSAAILLTPWSIGYGSADAAAAAGADMAAFRQTDTQSVPVVAGRVMPFHHCASLSGLLSKNF